MGLDDHSDSIPYRVMDENGETLVNRSIANDVSCRVSVNSPAQLNGCKADGCCLQHLEHRLPIDDGTPCLLVFVRQGIHGRGRRSLTVSFACRPRHVFRMVPGERKN